MKTEAFETQLEAYHQVQSDGTAAKARGKVYEIIKRAGATGISDAEVARKLNTDGVVAVRGAGPRRHELYMAGKVLAARDDQGKVKKAIDPVSGKRVTLWVASEEVGNPTIPDPLPNNNSELDQLKLF
jgi:hypothetical protein